MLIDTLTKQYDNAIKKKWSRIYLSIDLHDTILHSNYDANNNPRAFCPDAKEALIYLSTRKDICLILHTCTWPKEIEKYLEYFKEYDINFDFVNENKEIINDRLSYYSDKHYYNIGICDKHGFVSETDWKIVMNFFQSRSELTTK